MRSYEDAEHVSDVIPRKAEAFVVKYQHFVRVLQHLKVSQADFSVSREFWAPCRQSAQRADPASMGLRSF